MPALVLSCHHVQRRRLPLALMETGRTAHAGTLSRSASQTIGRSSTSASPSSSAGDALVDVADQPVVDAVADELAQAGLEGGRDRRGGCRAAGSPAGGCSRRSSSWRGRRGARRWCWRRRRARGCRARSARCPWPSRPGSSRRAGRSRGRGRAGGEPGMMRVAPFASVKSVSAHMRVADDGRVRLGDRDELVVGVDRLDRLARVDGDRRQRRDQAAGVEHALDDREHGRVHRHLLRTPGRGPAGCRCGRCGRPRSRWWPARRPRSCSRRSRSSTSASTRSRLDGVGDDRVALLGDLVAAWSMASMVGVDRRRW